MSALLIILCLLWLPDEGINLEPGKSKQDFDSVEEVQSHEDAIATEQEPEDLSWVPEAVLDVGYYLRKFKFNGYDPRYLKEGDIPRREMYRRFPVPPLKNLHWEVKKYCDASFINCLKYLQDTISQTVLPRHLDSLTVIRHNGWTVDNDIDLIRATNEACRELSVRDEKTFNVFQSPLKKFQWLSSASIYMCWYAMREDPRLKKFLDDCDNFADCFDESTGPTNGDFRANDLNPFACALHSFCPDPCCPKRLVKDLSECGEVNPCRLHAPSDETCRKNRSANVDFYSIFLNFWNVTCSCDEPGTRWDSRSGMCVDVDECLEMAEPCRTPNETCFNTPGGYVCACSVLGYVDDGGGNCVADAAVQTVLHPPKEEPRPKKKKFADNFFDFVYRLKGMFSVTHEEFDEADRIEDANVTTSEMP